MGHYKNVLTPTKIKDLSADSKTNQSMVSHGLLQNTEYVVEIACGPLHTIALTNQMKLFSCGYGDTFALGHGTRQTLNKFKLIEYFSDIMNQDDIIIKIAAGVSHSGCLTKDRLYLWGTQGKTTSLIQKKPNDVPF